MRLWILGGDERAREARKLCLHRGHSLPSHGPWDAVALPLPVSSITEEEADQLPRGQQVICGKTDAAFDCLAKKRGWELHRVLEDEAFTLGNAFLTAEGALCAAMNQRREALQGSRCLVIGYGRIGRALTEKLRGLGAQTTVAARRKESEAGDGSIPMELISSVLPQTDLVFNTVPSPILTASQLSFLPENGIYMELASPPYGISPEEAKKAPVHYCLESGVPGRYCPVSAARLLLEYIERTVKIP